MNEQNRALDYFIICHMAERQHWCWNLFCTTCGHCSFRAALYELSLGKSPSDNDWVTRAGQDRGWRQATVKYPAIRNIGFPAVEQLLLESESLHEVISEANIMPILEHIHFPANLGMLGIALYYTERLEARDKTITTTWKRQVEESGYQNYRQIPFPEGREQLTWQYLEEWERCGVGTRAIY